MKQEHAKPERKAYTSLESFISTELIDKGPSMQEAFRLYYVRHAKRYKQDYSRAYHDWSR